MFKFDAWGKVEKIPLCIFNWTRQIFFIISRARALQDFAYALVKSEMDTDFEDECKEIVERRTKAGVHLGFINK